jgi:hypothetical protein
MNTLTFEQRLRSGAEPKVWRPKDGETLIGILDRYETAISPWLSLLTTTARSTLSPRHRNSWPHCSSGGSRSLGSGLGIRYVGTRTSEKGVEYRVFYLRVDRPRPEPKYDSAGNLLLDGRPVVVDDGSSAEPPW